MENDDISTREGEVSATEQCQKMDQYFDRDQQNSHHVARRHIHDESLATTREATGLLYEGANPKSRDFSAESPSLLPAFTKIESHSYDLTSASVHSDTANVNRLEQRVAEQEQLPQSCDICGKNSVEDPRAMVRFLPRANASSDISLHVFCGKTASILPQVAQPHLEILLKAGLKNKHGIGPDVNFALARTRSAVAQGGEADKDPKRLDKEYYIVKEFEGHLRSIRSLQGKREPSLPVQMSHIVAPLSAPTSTHTSTRGPAHSFFDVPTVKPTSSKPRVHKASTNYIMAKGPYTHTQEEGPRLDWTSAHALAPFRSHEARTPVYRSTDLPPHGKVRCPCGGMYNPTKGVSSWRAHVKTKKHVLWSSHHSSSSTSINIMAYKNSNISLPLPTSELGVHESLRVGHMGEDEGNYEDQGNYNFHTSEDQGNDALSQPHISKDQGNYTLAQPHTRHISQPHTSEDQGNYTLAQPHTSNENGNYSAARPYIDEERVHCSNEYHLEGTMTNDTVVRQESTTKEAQR